MSTKTETLEDIQELLDSLLNRAIVLYNDEVNSFDYVILCLMKYCGHEMLQAEQCALIVHTNGKCKVKSGSYEELEPICTALLERGLTAEIEA